MIVVRRSAGTLLPCCFLTPRTVLLIVFANSRLPRAAERLCVEEAKRVETSVQPKRRELVKGAETERTALDAALFVHLAALFVQPSPLHYHPSEQLQSLSSSSSSSPSSLCWYTGSERNYNTNVQLSSGLSNFGLPELVSQRTCHLHRDIESSL